MSKVLVVGCGDLGLEIAKALLASGSEVVGVRANKQTLPIDASCIQADVTELSSLKPLVDLHPNIIIYCIAANTSSDEAYRTHYVDGLSNVLATQKHNRSLQHVFFVSSTRVYGQDSKVMLDEAVEPIPSGFRGRRLLEAEALLKELSCGGTAVRLAGIYGPGRLHLLHMAKKSSQWPKVNKWTNRIHRDDAARFVAWLCEKVVAGERVDSCYIGTDDMPALQYDVLSWLRGALDAEPLQTNADGLVEGKRFCNQRMHDSGFQLTYANYQQGYREMLKDA